MAWKRVHGDVFRKPKKFLEFAVLVGTGILVSFMAFTAFICATFGDSSMTTGLLVVLLPFYGFINGYISSIHYRFFKGSAWVKLSLISALFYPTILTIIYLMIRFCD